MVLIRLAHVAELPTPGDLVKRLTERTGRRRQPAPRARRRTAAAAARGCAPWRAAAPWLAAAPSRRRPAAAAAARAGARSWRSPPAASRCCTRTCCTASIPCASRPGRIEMRAAARRAARPRRAARRPAAGADRRALDRRALRTTEGEPTLAEQGRAPRPTAAPSPRSHPLVQADPGGLPRRDDRGGARRRRRRLRPGAAARRAGTGAEPGEGDPEDMPRLRPARCRARPISTTMPQRRCPEGGTDEEPRQHAEAGAADADAHAGDAGEAGGARRSRAAPAPAW